MKFIADLHVHSRHSRATSPEMCAEGLWRWAQLKGITVVGTGDFTHPEYFRELEEKLEPTGSGLFRLREAFASDALPASCRSDVYFMLQAEVSSIYSKGGRTRKVHSLVFAPGMKEAAEINRRLSRVGNLLSDGRPILGLDAERLLDMVLSVSPEAMVVPAHAWTPHFSVLGAASGFESLEECYGRLTPHIYAIETGLSSDPPMNRRLSALDNIALISNSDAHSPSNLGREGTIFTTGHSYYEMMAALKTGKGLWGTIEFFPEEGKYYLDGHRNCGVRLSPRQTRQNNYLCPVCGRRLTVGVLHRVEELSDRDLPEKTRFRSIIPLAEIVAETMSRGVKTKGVQTAYFDLLSALGNEFHILMDAPLEDMERAGGESLALAVSRVRGGEVSIEPGYDGVYGRVGIFSRDDGRPPGSGKGRRAGQGRLF